MKLHVWITNNVRIFFYQAGLGNLGFTGFSHQSNAFTRPNVIKKQQYECKYTKLQKPPLVLCIYPV